jgi:hypothetical protein
LLIHRADVNSPASIDGWVPYDQPISDATLMTQKGRSGRGAGCVVQLDTSAPSGVPQPPSSYLGTRRVWREPGRA